MLFLSRSAVEVFAFLSSHRRHSIDMQVPTPPICRNKHISDLHALDLTLAGLKQFVATMLR
jgi:hypothetical protein